MGRSVSTKLAPRMCFNAANNWQLGWYPNARRTISSINAPVRISLSPFVEYPSSRNTVLVKILSDTYLQFNGKSAHNDGTRAHANQVVVIRQETRSRLTTLLAGLSNGQTYRGSGFVVQVCSINGSRGAEISIGKTTASCTGTFSANSAPAPAPSGFSWTASSPTPGATPVGNPWLTTPSRTSPTSWFSAPIWPSTPSPPSPFTFQSAPSPPFGFSPSLPTFGFAPTPPSPFTFGFAPSPPSPPSPWFAPTPPSSFRIVPSPSPPTFSASFNNSWTTGWASIMKGWDFLFGNGNN